MKLEPGQVIDRYIVEARIGAGGMAVVYRVRHAKLGTRHAVKVLSSADPGVRDRLLQEGQVQAKLRHPNIVPASDVIEVDGHPALVMDFIRGPALDHWLAGYRPTTEEALKLFRGIVAGVGHAHAQGLVHRDLKSANIMLSVTDDRVIPMVTDFGLAKVSRTDGRMTQTGTTFGTPTFMAPEQIRDASAVDRRADLYSLGCILYELFTGRTPHVGDDLIELFRQVASGRYPDPRELNPETPPAVVDCVHSLVEVDVKLRVQDCAAVLSILDGDEAPTVKSRGALGPPPPLPDPGCTWLTTQSPGGAYAKRFVTRLDTPKIDPSWQEPAPETPPPSLPPPTYNDLSTSTLLGIFSGGIGVAALISLVVGLATAVVLLLLWRQPTAPTAPIAVVDPAPAPVVPTSPEPSREPVPEPAPSDPPSDTEPAPAQPRPVAPTSRPAPTEPSPEPAPQPAPAEPAPETTEPEPVPAEPAPAPRPVGPTMRVTFKSDPWGAKVWLDDRLLGTTPQTVDVPLGDHQVRMEHKGTTGANPISVRKYGTKAWKWNVDDGSWTRE